MGRMMIASDWNHGLIQGTYGPDMYPLDDPVNDALLRRIVARFDTIVFGWFALPIRDRLRSLSIAAGKHIDMYKYVDPTEWRPTDSEGSMSLIPSSNTVVSLDGQTCYKPEWCLLHTDGTPVKAIEIGGGGFIVDPTGPGLLEAAGPHMMTLADGFDGIFMDLLAPTYSNEIDPSETVGDYRWPFDEWRPVPGYAEAKIAFHSGIADYLAANGKKCMHNTTQHDYLGRYWPWICAEGSDHSITFVENFATTWGRDPATQETPGYGQWLDKCLAYMDWCGVNDRAAAFQALSNDAPVIKYGYSVYLQGATDKTIFSGCALDEGMLYSLEQTEISDYSVDMGAPTGQRTGGPLYTRTYENGIVVTNTSSVPAEAQLGGAYFAGDPVTSQPVPGVYGSFLYNGGTATHEATPPGGVGAQPDEAWDMVTVKWLGRTLTGAVFPGVLTICADRKFPLLRDSPVSPVTILPDEITAPLTVVTLVDGGVSREYMYVAVNVPASDDPDITGTGFTYTASVKLSNGMTYGPRTFTVPWQTPGGLLWLNKVLPATPSHGSNGGL